MKLRNQILRGFILLGLLPLLAALYGMMFYSEHLFLRNVDDETLRETERVGRLIVEEIQQRGELLDALSEAPHFQIVGQSLQQVSRENKLNEEFNTQLRTLQSLLASIQPLVAEDAVIRVLDKDGRTVVKVRFGSTSQPIFETLQPYRIIENEPPSELVQKLRSLPDNQTSYLELTGSNIDFLPLPSLALLDAVRPINVSDRRVYLTYSSRGERLNHLLRTIPRFRDARISIGTRSPQQVLFDDNTSLPFGGFPEQTTPPPLFYHLVQGSANDIDGVIVNPQTRFYYTEISPFPDQFISWVISAEIDQELLLDFFKPLRWGVILLSVTVLLLALLVGFYMSRRIAAPVSRLATNMNHYARGQDTLPDIESKTSEISQLQQAFTSMTADLKQAEAGKFQAEKQLAQAERLASVGEMAAGIGHELNNPLNNILSLGKLIRQDGPTAESFAEDLDDLLAEARRASTIVAGVLRFARQVPPEYQTVEVRPWLNGCLSRVTHLAQQNNITIQSQCKGESNARFDPHQLEQVVINLLTNAIQASPAGSMISATAALENGRLILEVTDEGSGMSESTCEHLFEPFYTTKGVGEGSGLGLSISLGIVESHQGKLTLTNRETRGVIARVDIPQTP